MTLTVFNSTFTISLSMLMSSSPLGESLGLSSGNDAFSKAPKGLCERCLVRHFIEGQSVFTGKDFFFPGQLGPPQLRSVMSINSFQDKQVRRALLG